MMASTTTISNFFNGKLELTCRDIFQRLFRRVKREGGEREGGEREGGEREGGETSDRIPSYGVVVRKSR